MFEEISSGITGKSLLNALHQIARAFYVVSEKDNYEEELLSSNSNSKYSNKHSVASVSKV
jgi:hypothetical protein